MTKEEWLAAIECEEPGLAQLRGKAAQIHDGLFALGVPGEVGHALGRATELLDEAKRLIQE